MIEVIKRLQAMLEGNKSHGVSAILCLVGGGLLAWYVGVNEGWMKTPAPTFALEGGMILFGQGMLGFTQAAGRNRIEKKLDVNTAITAEAAPEAAAKVMAQPVVAKQTAREVVADKPKTRSQLIAELLDKLLELESQGITLTDEQQTALMQTLVDALKSKHTSGV